MRIKRRILPLILVAIMVAALLPAGLYPISASAAGSGGDVLDKLGIDKESKPEGYYDRSHDSNPYGRDNVVICPVSELYIDGWNYNGSSYESESILYGHDIEYKKTIQNETAIMGSGISGYDGKRATAGDFDKDGLDEGIVTVGAKFLNEENEDKIKLDLIFIDPTNNEVSEKEIYKKDISSFGNLSRDNLIANPYLLQNYLQIAAGDFNGDGKDEIAVYVADQDNCRIEVYQLTGDDWLEKENWELVSTWSPPNRLDFLGVVPNMVCLRAGNMTGDGVDDLGITWGAYYENSANNASRAVILHGGKSSDMLLNSSDIPLFYGPEAERTSLLRASLAVGDADGDGKDELVVAGQAMADISENIKDSRFLAMYEYQNGQFVGVANSNIKGLGTKEGGDGYHHSGMVYNTNLALVKQNGIGHQEYVYLDGVIFQQAGNGFTDFIYPDNTQWFCSGDGAGTNNYYEYGAFAGDFNGDSRETLMLIQYFPEFGLYLLREIDTTGTNEDTNGKWNPVLWQYDDPDEHNTGFMQPITFAAPNTDTDSTRVKYTGTHYLAYTEPTVLAAIASPPYFKDLEHLDGGDNYVYNSFTSYGVSEGTEMSQSSYDTLSVGGYVSFELEFTMFGIKHSRFETELAYSHDFTWETESYHSNTYAVEYTTFGGQDTVVLYSYPMDVYVYDAFIPQTNDDGTITWEEQAMEINIPYTPVVKVLPLSVYTPIAEEHNLPDIDGEIFTHIVGQPGTYPNSTAGMKDANMASEYVGVGYGNAAITQSLEHEEGTSNGFSESNSVEFKIGAGPGGVAIGVTAGWDGGAGQATTFIAGKTYTGSVLAMPLEAENYGYDYSWKMVQYTYNGIQNFPVVNYLVTDVRSPGTLPQTFEVADYDKTSITLGWEASADPSVIGYQLYRHHKFPEGTGDYALGSVITAEEGKDYYTYKDEGLTPYTEYEYRIQTIRATHPTHSVLSDVLTARTRAPEGEPAITGPEDTLAVPDRAATLSVEVSNDAQYAQEPIYQWQKRVEGEWTDLPGKTDAALNFAQPCKADAGEYRCRVNQIVGQYSITSYSKKAVLSFMKRTPKIELDITDITDETTGITTSTEISATLTENTDNLPSCIEPSDCKPGGTVNFEISGSKGYTRVYRVVLDIDGTAVCDWETPPPGAYEIEVSYDGDRVYYGTGASTTHLTGAQTDYRLELEDSIVYGETFNQSVCKYTQEADGTVTTADVTDQFEYSVERLHLNTYGNWEYIEVPDWVDGCEVVAKKAGNAYRLKAVNNTDGIERIEGFIVEPRPITVTAPTLQTTQSDASHPDPSTLAFSCDRGEALVFNDTAESLGLKVQCLNSAGKVTEITGNTLPGVYTTKVHADGGFMDTQQNYKFTFLDGRYNITGPTYPVTCSTEYYNGSVVGTITAISPQDYESGKEYQAGTTVVFNASPYPGYSVKEWKVNGSTVEDDNGNVIRSNVLSQIMESEALDVIVSFQISDHTLEFNAEHGNVSSDDPTLTSGATVAAEAIYTFTATPDAGWHFKEWKLTTISDTSSTSYFEGTPQSDGTNAYQFTMPEASCILTAVFERDAYKLTLGDNLIAEAGEAGDKTPVDSGQMVTGDTTVTVAAAPGYRVPEGAKWYYRYTDSESAGEGESGFIEIRPDTPGFMVGGGTCSFAITRDIEITAEVEQQSYTVAYNAGNGGTVNIEAEGETTDENGIPYESGRTFSGGSEIVLTAQPDDGYSFAKWEQNEGSSATYTSEGNILTVAALDGNLDISAYFTQIPEYEISIECGNNGSVEATVNNGTPQIVEGKLMVREGSDVVLTAIPDTGYMPASWTIDNNTEYTKETTREIKNVTQNIEVRVTFMAKAYYDVTYGVSGGNGTISATADGQPFSSPTVDRLGGGSQLVFTAEPDNGYMVGKWEVTLGEDNPYTAPELSNEFTMMLSNNTDVKVSFENEKYHTVTSYVYGDRGGSIDIEGIPEYDRNRIRDRGTAIFTAMPDDGYVINKLTLKTGAGDAETVEGKLVDNGAQAVTVDSVEDDLEFTAEFAEACDDKYYFYFSADSGGTVSAEVYGKEIISGDWIDPGEKIELSASADSDYEFDGWTVVSGNINLPDYENVDFIMPENNVSVTARFEFIDDGGHDDEDDDEGDDDDNDDDTNGGSSGGGGGITTKTVNTIPASSDTTTVKVPYTLKDSTAILVLDNDIMNDLVQKSDKTDIVIDMSDVENISSLEFKIDGKWLNEDGKVISLTVKGMGEVTLSRDMLKTFGVNDDSTIHVKIELGSITIALDINGSTITGRDPFNPVQAVYPFDGNMSEITVIYDTKTGNILPFSLSDGKGNMKFLTPYMGTFEARDNPKIFNDIQGHWAVDFINFTSARELFLGTGYQEFSPDISMTRSMFVTVLGKLWGIEEADYPDSSFNDVSEGQWYSPYVEWASKNGIVEGYDGGLFGPGDEITREQMAAIIMRFAEFANIELTASTAEIDFADNANISYWAKDYVTEAQQAGLIQGKENNCFDPQGTATRAEVAKILVKFIENTVG